MRVATAEFRHFSSLAGTKTKTSFDRARFLVAVNGSSLHDTWYVWYLVLYQRSKGRFRHRGVGESVVVVPCEPPLFGLPGTSRDSSVDLAPVLMGRDKALSWSSHAAESSFSFVVNQVHRPCSSCVSRGIENRGESSLQALETADLADQKRKKFTQNRRRWGRTDAITMPLPSAPQARLWRLVC